MLPEIDMQVSRRLGPLVFWGSLGVVNSPRLNISYMSSNAVLHDKGFS